MGKKMKILKKIWIAIQIQVIMMTYDDILHTLRKKSDMTRKEQVQLLFDEFCKRDKIKRWKKMSKHIIYELIFGIIDIEVLNNV